MRIAIIGDIHGNEARLDLVTRALAPEKPKIALLVGDVGLDPPWREPARSRDRQNHDRSVRRVIEQVENDLDCPLLFVPGNHDLPRPPDAVADRNIDGRIVGAAGLVVAGFGGAGPALFGFPYEWTEEMAQTRLGDFLRDTSPPRVDIFLCHTPPAQTGLDRLDHGEHVGSRAVATWTARIRPRLFACGHIHEAFGVEDVGGVLCMNTGALGEPFGRAIGWTVEWEEGPISIESIEIGAAGADRRKWSL